MPDIYWVHPIEGVVHCLATRGSVFPEILNVPNGKPWEAFELPWDNCFSIEGAHWQLLLSSMLIDTILFVKLTETNCTERCTKRCWEFGKIFRRCPCMLLEEWFQIAAHYCCQFSVDVPLLGGKPACQLYAVDEYLGLLMKNCEYQDCVSFAPFLSKGERGARLPCQWWILRRKGAHDVLSSVLRERERSDIADIVSERELPSMKRFKVPCSFSESRCLKRAWGQSSGGEAGNDGPLKRTTSRSIDTHWAVR